MHYINMFNPGHCGIEVQHFPFEVKSGENELFLNCQSRELQIFSRDCIIVTSCSLLDKHNLS